LTAPVWLPFTQAAGRVGRIPRTGGRKAVSSSGTKEHLSAGWADGCPHPVVTVSASRPPPAEERLQGMWECLFGKLQRQQSLPVSVPGSVEGQLILSPCVMSSEQQNKDKDKNCRERS